jgi:hypothetical protein
MVCLVIITLAGAAIGVQGGNLFKYHQFRGVAQTFVFDLNKWRVLSMTLGSDVTCSIDKDKSGYIVTWTPDSPIEPAGSPLTYPLKGVKEVSLQGKKRDSYQFILFSSGRVSATDILTFSPSKKDKSISIDLSYPADLKEGPFKPSFKSALQKSNIPPFPEKKEKD